MDTESGTATDGTDRHHRRRLRGGRLGPGSLPLTGLPLAPISSSGSGSWEPGPRSGEVRDWALLRPGLA